MKDKMNPFRIPDLEADDTTILEFFDRYFNKRSVYRSRSMDRPALSIFYQLGRQWIERDTRILMEGVRGYAYKDIDQPEGTTLPRPVTNLVTSSVEMELSSLSRRELTPVVLTTSKDPRVQEAAKAAKEILEARLKANDWPELREFVTLMTIVTGTGCLKSYWDETWEDQVLKPKKTAVMCQGCGYVVDDPQVSLQKGKETGMFPPEATPEEIGQIHPPLPSEENASFLLSGCPDCGGELASYPVDEETASGFDSYGSPLGEMRPKGNTVLEVVSIFDLYPENSGVGVDGKTCKVWGQCTPRTMDWVCARYPDKMEQVEPDDPVEIMRYHNLLGEWALIGRFDRGMDSGIFEDYVLVHELISEKSYRFPEGRRIVVAGGVVLFSGPLYRTVQGEDGPVSVPTVKYATATWKRRIGEFWGQSLVDDLVSPQNRLNAIDAQITEARERMGTPNIMVSESMELTGPSYRDQYGGGKIMQYTTDPMNPTGTPEVFEGSLISGDVYQERDRIIQDMRTIAGPQEIEMGEAPKNVTTTSGLQLLGERAEARRGPRERSLIEMFNKIWKHQLELVWAFRDTSDEYELETKDGSFEMKMYDRTTLAGQTKVIIEKQAYVDKSLYQKEATREAMVDGLLVVDSQLARKRILELRGLPTDINEGLNRQVDLGKRQWIEFVDEGLIPSIDTLLDDYAIRFQALGEQLVSDEGITLSRAFGWPETLKQIAGWEEELQMAEMADAQAVAFYGGRLDPAQGEQAYAQAMGIHDEQMGKYEEAEAMGAKAAQETGQAPMIGAPPMPPPPPVFLPPAKEERIYMLWVSKIQKAQMAMMQEAMATGQMPPGMAPPTPGAEPGMIDPAAEAAAKDSFLRFMSVVAAYKLLSEEQAMAMMGGVPGAPAPGTPTGDPNVGGGPGGTPPTPAGGNAQMNMKGSNPGVG